MNYITCLNYIVWILSIVIGISLLTDFIKTEASLKNKSGKKE